MKHYTLVNTPLLRESSGRGTRQCQVHAWSTETNHPENQTLNSFNSHITFSRVSRYCPHLEVPGVHTRHRQAVAQAAQAAGAGGPGGDPVLHHAVHLVPGDAQAEVRHPHRHVLVTLGN